MIREIDHVVSYRRPHASRDPSRVCDHRFTHLAYNANRIDEEAEVGRAGHAFPDRATDRWRRCPGDSRPRPGET
jgi:hypothetical protein